MKCFLYLFLFTGFLFTSESKAQTRFLVKLKNKAGTPFSFSNPLAYLSQRAIDRRLRYSIAIDSTDLPATPAYIIQIKSVPNVTVLNVSKWLNSVSIQTADPNAITTINGFSFVQSVTGLAARAANVVVPPNKFKTTESTDGLPSAQRTVEVEADFYNYGNNSFNEIKLH